MKTLPWLCAALLAGVSALLSLRAQSRVSAIAGVFGVLLPIGLLPIEVSLLALVLTSNMTALSSWYLWLTFAALIHLDRVFAIGALLAGVVSFAIPGTHRARLLRTLACLAMVIIVAMVYTAIQLHRFGLVS